MAGGCDKKPGTSRVGLVPGLPKAPRAQLAGGPAQRAGTVSVSGWRVGLTRGGSTTPPTPSPPTPPRMLRPARPPQTEPRSAAAVLADVRERDDPAPAALVSAEQSAEQAASIATVVGVRLAEAGTPLAGHRHAALFDRLAAAELLEERDRARLAADPAGPALAQLLRTGAAPRGVGGDRCPHRAGTAQRGLQECEPRGRGARFRARLTEGTPQPTDEAATVTWWSAEQVAAGMVEAFAARILDGLRADGPPAGREHSGVHVMG